jgi:hypothetical protein
VPVVPKLTNTGGQVIPVEEVRLDALYGEHSVPWSYPTNRKVFSGQLVVEYRLWYSYQ